MTPDSRPRGLPAIAAGSYRSFMWWRRHQLMRAGFDEELADLLAKNHDVDLHAVLDLVARGCPPHLAARILAPSAGQKM